MCWLLFENSIVIKFFMNVNDKIKALTEIIPVVTKRLEACDLCPRNCKVNRSVGERGYCGAGKDVAVYTVFVHKGEEPAISGTAGSGAIFFSGCNLRCCYCQNYKFSQSGDGRFIGIDDVAGIMIKLQAKGVHNINLVTPTPYLPQILQALLLAYQRGLKIPVVYNTSGYEHAQVIGLLAEVVDIYLPDMKYASSCFSARYSSAADYPLCNQRSIRVMYGQKTTPSWRSDILESGLVIRHLVLPGHIQETLQILSWIKAHAPKALLSLMFQYQPYHEAARYPEINRKIVHEEYEEVSSFMSTLGLKGWVQEFSPQENLAGVYFAPSLEEFL
ncbi:MAG: radical SAM protein [Candidatus Omnitrophota bacterium]